MGIAATSAELVALLDADDRFLGGYILPGSTWSRLFLMVSQWNSETNWPYHSMQFEADVSALQR